MDFTFMKFKFLTLKSRVLLTGHSVAIVTYCITKMMTTNDWAVF